MTPPHFQIGKKVEIIGPTITGDRWSIGEKFVISQCRCGEYTGDGFPWYPASSLRLVEELKIDDWVRVVGPTGNGSDFSRGYIFQISEKSPIGEFSTKKAAWYPAASLQKLTPDEIQQHQTAQMLPKSTETQELRRRIHDLEMSLNGFTNGPEPEYVSGIVHVKDPIRKRLSAIESRQKEDRNLMTEIEERLDERLDILEGEKPEMVDSKKPDVENLMEGIRRLHADNSETCHRNPKRNCALKNVVNRMDCAICEEVAQKVLDSMRKA